MWGIEEFEKRISTSKKIFNLDEYDVDFLFHVYNNNYDLILKDKLTAQNMVIPVKKNYDITTKCTYSKSGFEYYAYEKNIYSLKSIYWEYNHGDFYPNDGKLVQDDDINYEMFEWEIDDASINENIQESKEERLKKLLIMKEIVDRKIKELL
jgi:ligand-binding SRPBCC domain-containing protein